MNRQLLTIVTGAMRVTAAGLCLFAGSVAIAQTPFNGTLQCTAANPNYLVDVGDFTGHQAVLQKSVCTITQPFLIAADKPVQDSSVYNGDLRGNRISGNGTNVITMENGDLAVFSYRVNVTLSGGVAKTCEGTFQWIGGTGAMKGIAGKGTLTGNYAADGSLTLRIQGDYAVNPAAAGGQGQ